MADGNQNAQEDSEQNNESAQISNGSTPSTPDDNIQAPPSEMLKKSIPSSMFPNEDIEAPKSEWLNEGSDIEGGDPLND